MYGTCVVAVLWKSKTNTSWRKLKTTNVVPILGPKDCTKARKWKYASVHLLIAIDCCTFKKIITFCVICKSKCMRSVFDTGQRGQSHFFVDFH